MATTIAIKKTKQQKVSPLEYAVFPLQGVFYWLFCISLGKTCSHNNHSVSKALMCRGVFVFVFVNNLHLVFPGRNEHSNERGELTRRCNGDLGKLPLVPLFSHHTESTCSNPSCMQIPFKPLLLPNKPACFHTLSNPRSFYLHFVYWQAAGIVPVSEFNCLVVSFHLTPSLLGPQNIEEGRSLVVTSNHWQKNLSGFAVLILSFRLDL